MERRALIIINASSGWDDKEDAPTIVRRIFHARGIDCVVTRVAAGTDIGRMAAEAVRKGTEFIVAGGGDGTLRAVASAVAGTGAVMGVLPVGTLNHFARDMEIPLDLEEAAVVAAGGTPVAVDVGEVNGRTFINNAVIGLYPAYRFERDAREARGWRRWRAVAAGLWAVFRRYPFLTVRLQAEGVMLTRRTPFILIGNNEHAMQGFKPWHRERMTEGKLWLFLMRDRSRLGLLRLLFRMLAGRVRAADQFDVLRAAGVWVETPRRSVGVSLDGEVVRLRSPLHFRSRPRELRVMVPPGSRRVAEFVCERAGGEVSG